MHHLAVPIFPGPSWVPIAHLEPCRVAGLYPWTQPLSLLQQGYHPLGGTVLGWSTVPSMPKFPG